MADIKGRYSDNSYSVSDHSEFYKDCENEGFHVMSVESSLDDKRHIIDHMEVETPYSYQGRSVFAKTSVDVENTRNIMDRDYFGCELYVLGKNALDAPRNFEDVSGMSAGKCDSNISLQTRDGKEIPYFEALDKVGLYSTAASSHPHVMSYDECKPIYDKTHEQINSLFAAMGEPVQELTEDTYAKYLDKCEAMMRQAPGLYIGEITSPEAVKAMNLTVPSFRSYCENIGKANALQRDCDIMDINESEEIREYDY